MKPILQKYAFRLLCLLYGCSVTAQETLYFGFEHNGEHKEGASVVFFLKLGGGRLIKSGDEVGINENNGEINLYCKALRLKGEEMTDDVRIVMNSADCVKLSNNLEFVEDPNIKLNLRTGRLMPIKLKKEGEAFVRINRLYSGTKGEEKEVELKNPVELRFTITNNKPTSSVPVPIAPTNIEKTTAPGEVKRPTQAQPESDKKQTLPPDIAAYNEAKSQPEGQERIIALQNFIRKWRGKSDKADAALKLIPVITLDTMQGDIRRYTLDFACNPHLDSISGGSNLEIVGDTLGKEKNSFVLQIKTNTASSAVIYISDRCKEKIEHRLIKIRVSGKAWSCTVKEQDDNKAVLSITGGNPPFFVTFFQNSDQLIKPMQRVIATDREVEIKKAEFRSESGRSGIFTVQVVDDFNQRVIANGTISIPPAQPLWPFLIGVLALALAAFGISKYRQHARNKAVEAKMKKFEESQTDGQWSEPGSDAPAASAVKIRSAAPPTTDPRALSEADFNAALKKDSYHALHLKQQWPDTVLTEIHLSQKSIQGIGNFLHEQRSTVLDEKEGTIPEIGGFLLGKYSFSEKTKQYRVLLEEFVPVIPEEHNVYQLHFSTESLVRELGDMQDEYPELSLVGWFHTHPGHGLFLSRPDLTIHDGFFKENYQFAMEIDTMTPRLDTGFFSRTASGAVNNMETQAPETNWFFWTDIEQQNKP